MNARNSTVSPWLLILTIAAVLPLQSEAAEPVTEPSNAKKPKVESAGLAPGGIQWQSTFESALELARKQEKPLMVDFETDWCGFCKKLDRETYGNEKVIRFVRQFFVSVKVDGDKRTDLRQKFAIEGYPTIVFLSPHATEIKRIVGFRPAPDFLEEAGKAARSSSTLRKLKEEATASPDDADAQRVYARALFAAGNSATALAVLKAHAEKHPADRRARLDLADVLKTTGELEEACVQYEAVLKGRAPGGLVPAEGVPAEGVSAEEAKDSGNRDDIRAAYLSLARTRLKLEPRRAKRLEALFLRAYAQATLGRAEAALADLKSVEELDVDGFWGLRASLIRELVEVQPDQR